MIRSREVLTAWVKGCPWAVENLSTDGWNLYSYDLKIGTYKDGLNVVYDYTAPGGKFISMTTSAHVNAAKRWADKLIDFNQPKSHSRW
jgi:hypothetical protein